MTILSASSQQPESVETDLAAITDIVERLARSQTEEGVNTFVALFRRDAIWTTAHGRRLYGRDAIADFTATVLPGSSRHGHATYELERVLFIRPDVAAVKIVQRYVAPDGSLDSTGTPMLVLAKEDGAWLLVANQNTPVVD